MTRKNMVMGTGHFKYLVDQAKELGAKTISVFGYGEPLIDKEIAEKVRYCTHNDLKTFVTTNASLLNYDMSFDLLKAGIRQIRFSVHALSPQNYNEIHKGLLYQSVMRNIGNFTAINNKYKFGCRIQVTVIPMNGEDLDSIKMAWKGFELEVWKPHNWTDGRQYRKLTKKRKKTCGRPHKGPVQINADGKMMVCCFDYNAEMIVGDTHKNTIEDILKSDAFNSIRKQHESGNLSGLPCKTCDQLNIGDSPLLYSTVDSSCAIGKTSSTKFKLEGD